MGLHRHQERRLLRLQVGVDELVAKYIVNTMPEKTLNALAHHGNGAPSIKGTYEESHAIINKLAELGINLKDVTDKPWRPTVSLPSSSPGIPAPADVQSASTA